MIQKGSQPYWGNPKPDQDSYFKELKQALVEPPTLSLQKRKRPFMIDTDARKYAMGATLLPQQDQADKNTWATIRYWMETLYDRELKYSET